MKWTLQDYSRVEKVIHFLEKNYQRQPELGEIARSANLSEFHLQRLFRRWAGITPKKFVQFLTLGLAKSILLNDHSLLEATYESGLSSPGRLHDLFVNVEAMTPGEFRTGGQGLQIHYGHGWCVWIGVLGSDVSFLSHNHDGPHRVVKRPAT